MKKVSLIVVFIFVLIATNLCVYFWMNNKNGSVIDSNLKDYTEKVEVPEGFTEDQILIPGFENISVGYDSKEKGLELLNPKVNNVYFKYEVVLDEGDRVLAETKMIPPGKAVDVFPWEGLSPKSYDVTVRIRTYSIENLKKELNGAELKIKMNVLKEEK